MKNNKKSLNYAVIGAGNGGQAMAAHLALCGHNVRLYNRSITKIKKIQEQRGIYLTGKEEGFGRLSSMTDNIKEAIENADVIMVTIPASGHREIANLCHPYLKDGQIIVLNPGRTGGALEFLNIIKQKAPNKNIIISEAQTFVYACRAETAGVVKIFSIKNQVSLASIPSYMTKYVVDTIKDAYPQFIPADNVLETSLNNIGAIFHPCPTLLNCGRIESTNGDFEYYLEGITPTVSKILEQMDSERVKVAHALGVKTVTALKWLEVTYGSKGESLHEAIQNTSGYMGIKAPSSMDTRYIFEDIPESLVPISAIGATVGIRTPIIDSIINLACTAHGENYFAAGRNVRNLGIEGLTVSELMELATFGIVERPREVVA
ncbi:opine dehydrogenase [Oxobacter pfennigii]|uniref:Opine dehydrogenase n=1 Tax=Oxobacter pfennigii TaxID=36849 RepID=A0A0P8WBR2_9CLOT|nr:NAD/NADP-dependent octopine/nopaline dehydrogenase family protein [Oxobacter pfennigii]KPU46082.1 opine dehydrogenase [Oxobacter pfennigii]